MKSLFSLFLLVIFLKQLVWITFIPIWHTPDEQAHFAQVSLVSELNRLLMPDRNNTSKEIWLSEYHLGTLRDSFGNNKFTYRPNHNLPYGDYLTGPSEELLSSQPPKARKEFIIKEATGYPPVYYVLASGFYNLLYGESLFDRVFVTRIFSAFLLVITGYLTYRIGKLIFSDNFLALSLSLLVAFHPMVSFVFAGVSSDPMFIALFTATIFLCLRVLVKNDLRAVWVLLPTVLLSIYTKPQAAILGAVLMPVALFVMIKVIHKRKVLIIPIIALLALGFWGVYDRISRGESIFPESEQAVTLKSLAMLPSFLSFTLGHTYKEVLPWYWGVFRWLSLGLPDILRRLTNLFTFTSLTLALVYIFLNFFRKKFTAQSFAALFLLVTAVIYFASLTLFDFGFYLNHSFSFGIQGRYFFPIIASQMTLSLLGLTFLFSYRKKVIISWGLSLLFVLFNSYVFLYVTLSYYSPDLTKFVYEASQYKPLWLKFPVNLSLITVYLILLGVFFWRFSKNFQSRLTSR